MTTTVLFIRHGETDWNVARRWQGYTDIPLNETGRGQARALGKRLASWPIAAIYTSDLQRASETAELVAEPHPFSAQLVSGWRERGVGDFAGMTREEIEAKYPMPPEQRESFFANPPNGEPTVVAQERAVAAYEALLAEHKGEMVAVVTHGGILNSMAGYILGLPGGTFAAISFRANTGLTIVEVNGENNGRIVLLNDGCHLGT